MLFDRPLRLGALGMAIGLAATSAPAAQAESRPTLVVQAGQPGAPPTQIGVFFEDINFGADGGLYPERVKNRSFEFDNPHAGWHDIVRGGAQGSIEIRDDHPLAPTNRRSLRLRFEGPPDATLGIANEGFFGVAVEKGKAYDVSAALRSDEPGPARLVFEVVAPDGRSLGRVEAEPTLGPNWERCTARLTASATEPKARFEVRLASPRTIDLDMISLFPVETYRNRSNGLRPDLVEWLSRLKPAFIRFPGGCIVEGRDLSLRYQWKTTIGPLGVRRLIKNRWNDEFEHRPAPDYYQSFGLGFYEYFLLCEDLGAAPLPILNCGMACQFNSGQLVPLDQLDPFLQDALDLIAFANGPADSSWGRIRAEMGHPAPFGMKLLGIGNEQWGPEYIARYERFAKLLKANHPEIQLISSAGPRPADDLYRYAWPRLRELDADIVDEHCYDKPAWFLDNARRYDDFPREGPKVFMGEYAAQSDKVASPKNRNNWDCALAEAAYLTGLERNSDVVTMSSYAPLFGHLEGWQWTPNLIWCDNLRSYGTPSYYVQQLFSVHRGDAVVPVAIEDQPPATSEQQGLYASASRLESPATLILKVVNSASEPREAALRVEGAAPAAGEARAVVLTSKSLADENSLAEPTKVAPREAAFTVPGPALTYRFEPQSLTVLRIPLEKPSR